MRYCAELYLCFSDNIFVYCLGKDAQEWDKTIINDTDSSELFFNVFIPCSSFCRVCLITPKNYTPLVSFLDYFICCTSLIPCIALPCLRHRFREKYDKEGNCCNDVVQSLCCYPCTLRTLKATMDNPKYQESTKLKSPFMVNSILDTTISIKDLRSP